MNYFWWILWQFFFEELFDEYFDEFFWWIFDEFFWRNFWQIFLTSFLTKFFDKLFWPIIVLPLQALGSEYLQSCFCPKFFLACLNPHNLIYLFLNLGCWRNWSKTVRRKYYRTNHQTKQRKIFSTRITFYPLRRWHTSVWHPWNYCGICNALWARGK